MLNNGYGYGHGNGYGRGNGSGDGSGDGNGSGDGYGSGSGGAKVPEHEPIIHKPDLYPLSPEEAFTYVSI